MHEHLQPVGDARRGPARPQRRRARADGQAVGEDLARARARRSSRSTSSARGLAEPLEALGFHLVGYGCTTCIGNSGPLPEEISDVVDAEDLAVVSVLSGNRNFEGRINPDVKMNYLASPPLCVAYALAGTMDIDLLDEPLGPGRGRRRRLPQGHLAERRGGRPDGRGGRAVGHVPQLLRRGVRRRRALELARGARGRPLRVGRRLDLRAPAAVLRGPRAASRRSITDIEGARVLAHARRLGHHRPHLARRRDQEGLAGRRATSTSTASSTRTSTPTARAAATTR